MSVRIQQPPESKKTELAGELCVPALWKIEKSENSDVSLANFVQRIAGLPVTVVRDRSPLKKFAPQVFVRAAAVTTIAFLRATVRAAACVLSVIAIDGAKIAGGLTGMPFMRPPINSLTIGSTTVIESAIGNVVGAVFAVAPGSIQEAVAFLAAASVSDSIVVQAQDFGALWGNVVACCEFVVGETGIDLSGSPLEVIVLGPSAEITRSVPLSLSKLVERCHFRFLDMSSDVKAIANACQLIKPLQSKRKTGDVLPRLRMAASVFWSVVDTPFAIPIAKSAIDTPFAKNVESELEKPTDARGFLRMCLHWLPESPLKAFDYYREYQSTGNNDFMLLRRIIAGAGTRKGVYHGSVEKARIALESGDRAAGVEYAKYKRLQGDELVEVLERTLPCVAGFIALGNYYDQESDLDRAYVYYRDALVGSPSRTTETDKIVRKVTDYFRYRQIRKLVELGCEFIELLGEPAFPAIAGDKQAIFNAVGDAPAAILLRARSLARESAAALCREVIGTNPEVCPAAEFELAKLSSADENRSLMREAAEKGPEGAKWHLLGEKSDCPGEWPIGAREFIDGLKKFMDGDRLESDRLWRSVPVDVIYHFKKASKWAVLGFMWSKCVDRGNSFEAAYAKIAFAKTLMLKSTAEVQDWMMALILLEQAFATPNLSEMSADEVPDIVDSLDKRVETRVVGFRNTSYNSGYSNYGGFPPYDDELAETFERDRAKLATQLRRNFPNKCGVSGHRATDRNFSNPGIDAWAEEEDSPPVRLDGHVVP
jgi:hypothetical protein